MIKCRRQLADRVYDALTDGAADLYTLAALLLVSYESVRRAAVELLAQGQLTRSLVYPNGMGRPTYLYEVARTKPTVSPYSPTIERVGT